MNSDNSLDLIRETTTRLLAIYAEDNPKGRTTLISLFIAPLGAFAADDRARVLQAVNSIAQDIGEERFEDGQDYMAFLKDNLKERLERGG